MPARLHRTNYHHYFFYASLSAASGDKVIVLVIPMPGSARRKQTLSTKSIEQKMAEYTKTKQNSLTAYARGEITHAEHSTKCKECDIEIAHLKEELRNLLANVPTLHRDNVVEANIERYTNTFKTRLAETNDFDSTRQLLRDYIKHIIFTRGNVEIHGAIPILLNAYSEPDQTSEVQFVIKSQVPSRWHSLPRHNRSYSGFFVKSL